MISGVYMILNKKNDRVYVGSSQNVGGRFIQHKTDLARGRHANAFLQNSWAKNGEASFRFVLLERCPVSRLLKRETTWMRAFPEKYNFGPSSAPTRGAKMSQQTKAKCGAALKKSWQEKSHPARKRAIDARTAYHKTMPPQRREEINRKIADANGQQVVVLMPSGRLRVFRSQAAASRFLGRNPASLHEAIERGGKCGGAYVWRL